MSHYDEAGTELDRMHPEDGEADGISSDDRAVWLDARRSLVTASDCGALLGCNDYKTRAMLRMEKAGLAEEFAGNEYTEYATDMEPLIIRWAGKKFGWKIQPHGRLLTDAECPRLGATPDALVSEPWEGIAQIKVTVCKPYEQVKKHGGEPPLSYQVQVNAELAVTGEREGRLLVLHSFPRWELREYPVQRNEAVIRKIREEVARFWDEVEALKNGKVFND